MATLGVTQSVLLASCLLPSGQERVSFYCNTVNNTFYMVDDNGNEVYINGAPAIANTNVPNTAGTASYGATNSFYGTTTAILAKPDKWITIVQGTQSYYVPAYAKG